mgnify:CR=1 FL=1
MKKILIYEYFTGGGLINEELCSSSLLSEAKAIINSIINEYSKSRKYQVYYFIDHRLELDNFGQPIIVRNLKQLYDIKLLKSFDLILPVLPEQNMELYAYSKFLSQEKIKMLLSSPETIKLLSDKYKFSTFCEKTDIPSIPSYLSNQINFISNKIIIEKHRYGIGCSHVKKIAKHHVIDSKKMIYQPYIKGDDYSLCVYFTKTKFKLLTLNEQDIIVKKNNLRLRSLKVNIKNNYFLDIYILIKKIHNNLPGLYGYIGIDIIITGKGILVVEINPRLTTSFTGISSTLGINLSQINKFMESMYINPRSRRIHLS